jgi:hypothetical protein
MLNLTVGAREEVQVQSPQGNPVLDRIVTAVVDLAEGKGVRFQADPPRLRAKVKTKKPVQTIRYCLLM